MSDARQDAFGDALPEGAVARLGTSRFRQAGVCSLAFSPDGTQLASGGTGPLHVWNAATGEEQIVLTAAFGEGLRVAWSPEGALAGVPRSGPMMVWHGPGLSKSGARSQWFSPMGTPSWRENWIVVSAGKLHLAGKSNNWKQQIVLEGVTDAEAPAAFGGERLAIAGGRNDVMIFAVPGGQLRARIPTGIPPTALALSPTGGTLAAGFPDGRIGLWDIASRRQVSEWPAHPIEVTALAFSTDAQTVASGAGVRIKLWNPASGGERLELPGFDEPPAQINFRPDAPRLVTRTGLALQEWDAETGSELSQIPARGRWDDGSRLPETRFVALGEPGAWDVWDAATGKRTLHIPDPAETAAVSVDGTLFATAISSAMKGHGWGATVALSELPSGKQRWARNAPHRSLPTLLRFLPDGNWLLCGSTYDHVGVLDVQDGKEKLPMTGPVAVSRDGDRIACTFGNGDDVPRAILVYERKGKSWNPTHRIPLGSPHAVRAIAFAPFQGLLAAAHAGDEILVWKLASPRRTRVKFRASAHALVFNADGRRLASVSWTSGEVLVWDVPA